MSVSNAAKQSIKNSKKEKEKIKGTPENKKETDNHASTKWQNKINKHLKRRLNRNELKRKLTLSQNLRNQTTIWTN